MSSVRVALRALGANKLRTTLTMLVVRGHEAFVAHVGDSRAYLIRGTQIRQLTEDHSLVSELVQKGVDQLAKAGTGRPAPAGGSRTRSRLKPFPDPSGQAQAGRGFWPPA